MKTSLVNFDHVSLTTTHMDRPILANISYQIYQGDFIVLLGSNGSGKSSLLKLLNRQYHATSGEIRFNNQRLSEYSATSFSRYIKTLTQHCDESLFSSLTLLDNYLLVKQQYESNLFSVRDKHDREFLADYLQNFNPNLANKLDQTVSQLSGGEKQALALALTVLYPPQLLLLDEHTSALDPKTGEQIMSLTNDIIHKHNITCILTTHDLNIARQYGNKILALKQGQMHLQMEHDGKSAMTETHLLAECY
jgi:putative ABC transport system ATP-binding protein